MHYVHFRQLPAELAIYLSDAAADQTDLMILVFFMSAKYMHRWVSSLIQFQYIASYNIMPCTTQATSSRGTISPAD